MSVRWLSHFKSRAIPDLVTKYSLKAGYRFNELEVEAADLYDTAGVNDNTRAFASIPSRHAEWPRASCDGLAGLVVQGLSAEDEADAMAHGCAYGMALRA